MERKLAKFSTDEFKWQIISEDDFICEKDDYCLRIEQMWKNMWWWRVYYKDEPLPSIANEYSNSKYKAIGYCEGMYLGHSLNNIINQ